MSFRFGALLIGVLLVGGFALLNWQTIMAETPLSFGFAEVMAPLGLILLGLLLLVVVLALVVIFFEQARTIRDVRRSEKEVRQQRELADKAEASRFVELQRHLDESFAQWKQHLTDAMGAQDRLRADLESRLMQRLEDDGKSVSAMLGEIEDKLDRSLGNLPESGPGAAR